MASEADLRPPVVSVRQQGVGVIPNSLHRPHLLQNLDLDTFQMAPFRVAVLGEMASIRNLRFATPATRTWSPFRDPPLEAEADRPLYSLAEVKERGVRYLDDGTVLEPGAKFEYEDLTLDVFERLDFGDVRELVIERREIDGDFPGMDVEPIE